MTKKEKRIIEQFNKEIIGAVLLALGIIVLFSLFSSQMGIIGNFLKTSVFSLMGFGGYLFPILLISIGIVFIMDRFDNKEFKNTISLIIFLILFLVLLDSNNIGINGFMPRIRTSLLQSKKMKGGGIIGSAIGIFFYKLFGKLGGYLVLLFGFLINLMIFTRTNLKDVFSSIADVNYKKNFSRFKNKILSFWNDIFKREDNSEEKIKNYEKKSLNKGRTISDHSISELEDKDMKEDLIAKNPFVDDDITPMKVSKESSEDIEEKLKSQIQEQEESMEKPDYIFPSIDLLKTPVNTKSSSNKEEMDENADKIEETMKNFGIESKIVHINRGPTITSYELEPAPSVKLSRIVSLSDNIALSLASSDIRIEAPIPGKAAVGIEVPNRIKENVLLKEMIMSDEFKNMDSNIPLTLGKDVTGKPIISSIDKMPHLLIAGATGSGKSVCINTIIMSIIYKSKPSETKLLMIDPKVVELSVYNGIPHLITPVITEAKKSAAALNWAVQEMEKRYDLFASSGVRDIHGYNRKVQDKRHRLSNIVIIIDELADLMMVAANEIEDYITRLAQMARAAGMHLIIATQRPSVDVITGTIKANIPSRISFAVSSNVDSRTILDIGGAEKLLGQGDMLFYPSSYSKPKRIQGAFISDEEVEEIVNFLKSEDDDIYYDEDAVDSIENKVEIDLLDSDPLIEDAIQIVIDNGEASMSELQRTLKIGYNRAREIIEELEIMGVVGQHKGSRPRKVLISDINDLNKKNREEELKDN